MHFVRGSRSLLVTCVTVNLRTLPQVNPIFPHVEAYTYTEGGRDGRVGCAAWVGDPAARSSVELTISPPGRAPSKALQLKCDLRVWGCERDFF